jgi:hypothetical protein
MQETASSPNGHWSELYRAERFATFRWAPTQDVLEQLRACLPHHPTQISTQIPKGNVSS